MSFFSQISYANSTSLDAFARVRTAEGITIFDHQNEYDASPLLFEDILNGGSATHVPEESSVRLSTGAGTSGNFAYRQSREYFRYQPGHSRITLQTALMGALKANVRQRVGHFDVDNGHFFEQDGTNLKVVQRSKASGVVVDTAVNQSAWNVDKLNGTGPSGVTIDTSKTQIFFVDLQWLGVGRVRMGVYIAGFPVVCHQFNNSNTMTTVFMTTANLPVRYEVENTGAATGATTLDQICVSVVSEGGFDPTRGVPVAVANNTAPSVNARRAVLSIRPRATFNSIVTRSKIIVDEFEAITGAKDAFYEIVYNPTFTGTPVWTNADTTRSSVEYSIHADAAAGAFTDGLVIENGFFSGKSAETGEILQRLPLVLDHAGANPLALSLVCTGIGGATTISGTLSWLELY